MLPRDIAACPADDCPLHQRCERWRPEPTGDGLPRVWFLNRPEWGEDGCAWFMEKQA